jgi:hypothetical protein
MKTKYNFGDLYVSGRIILKCTLRKYDVSIVGITLAHDTVHWRSAVNVTMKLLVPSKAVDFLIS